MLRTHVVIRAATLAVTTMIAVPAAQAAVPPSKKFTTFLVNGVQLTKTPRPIIVVGAVVLHNIKIGNLECESAMTGQVRNETTEGTEKGLLNVTGYMTYQCIAQNPCKVKNTKGEEVEGIYATAESPPEPAGTEAHPTGISSLPWTGELIERETPEVQQLLTKHVKLWLVLPPKTVGAGTGCAGTEIELEDLEGKTEKEAGYELAPLWLNGTKNGLKASNEVFEGEEGLTEKGFPRTGRLSSPQVGPFYVKSSLMRTGGLGGGWELITGSF